MALSKISNVSQDNLTLGRDFNRVLPEYEAGVLTSRQQYSMPVQTARSGANEDVVFVLLVNKRMYN